MPGTIQPCYTLISLKGRSSRDLISVRNRLTERSPSFTWVLAGLPPTNGVSLSPPFVHSIAFSEHGVMVAGTADGRVWIGKGGDKSIASKKKRSRRWEGLRENEGSWFSIAEGPVVSV